MLSTNNRIAIFARTPDPVTGLTATTTMMNTSARLSWNALPTGVVQQGQLPLRDYVVELSTDGGSTWQVAPTPTSTSPTATISGLDPTKSYIFRVSAWNEAGNGDAMTVTPTAATLTAFDDTATTHVNVPVSVNVLANDGVAGEASPDPSTLRLVGPSGPVSTLETSDGKYEVVSGEILYTPTAGFIGRAQAVTYQVSNADGAVANAKLTVTVLSGTNLPKTGPSSLIGLSAFAALLLLLALAARIYTYKRHR
jgi:LPXTG-motif cell wall-anchored protein